ncbi:protoporphyrinogen oxidase [Bacillus massilinigeriensis]|uniref:protoporphyrinogen oxidase n=1 Tax=Bacillus mediterraneensis TaxID=1805474 RepID=UPI0008F8114E|nr:protoporphyrinogen oxidase [Bacillus mediterraneensis]
MSQRNKKVVVIGGGITGLTAAYYLQKQAREYGLPLDVTLVEASHQVGGKMRTVVKDGFVIERGPDSFLERKESAGRLAREVGLGDKIVNNSAGKSYVLVRDRLHPMPGGSIMGIPTEIGPFVTTKLFSWSGKFRAAADFFMPPTEKKEDQTLGTFFRRRLGDEVVENLVEPLLSGIYAGDIDRLSLMATFPQFYHIEQKYGSLVRGMKKTTPKRKSAADGEKKKGIFISISTGLQSMAEAIERKLDEGSVLKCTRVDKVTKDSKGYEVRLSTGETLKADSIVMCVPPEAALHMFPEQEHLFAGFKEMPFTSVATISMAFPESAIKEDIDGTGFVVSRNSDYAITACTWTHKKWAHSAPAGKALLRCYVGRPGDEAIVDAADAEIVQVALGDLQKIMNISGEPEFTVVTRWKESMPQYTVGHRGRIEELKKGLAEELPGVYAVGSSFEGLGIPDCIDQGEGAVKKVLSYLDF